MKGEIIIKSVVFSVIVLAIMNGLGAYFHFPNKQFLDSPYTLSIQTEDTVDVVMVGASNTYRTWSSVSAWRDYGFTSWVWGTASQPFAATEYIIRDVKRRQSPELFLISYSDLKRTDTYSEGAIRYITDSISPSFNRMSAILSLSPKASKTTDTSLPYWVFPFLRFHDDWELVFSGQLEKAEEHTLMGTLITATGSFPKSETDIVYEASDSYANLNESEMRELEHLLSWVKENDIPVLFLLTPGGWTTAENSRLNTVEATLEKYDVDYLNLAKQADDIGLDKRDDFRDRSHLNYWGMKKTTSYLSQYLVENYDLPDHRGDPAYTTWDKAQSIYSETVNSIYRYYAEEVAPETDMLLPEPD